VNENGPNENNLLQLAIIYNDIDIFRLILNYICRNNIIVELNKKNVLGDYPFLFTIKYDTFEIVQLFLNYVNKNIIIIELKEKNIDGIYSLLEVIN